MKKRIKLSFYTKNHITAALFFVVSLGFLFRIFQVDWDSGYYFHPDERAIIMSVTSFSLPNSVAEFYSDESPLRPDFFAYGSFPLYLLYFVSSFLGHINPLLSEYGGIFWVGRVMSAFFDSLTILLVYFIGREIFSKKAGLIASFFYSVSVLPIQLSHFFAVDTLLTFFLTGTFLFLLLYHKEREMKFLLLFSLFFGFAIATKVSALIILPVIMLVLLTIQMKKGRINVPNLKEVILDVVVFSLISFACFILLQPYAVISWDKFLNEIALQSRMSNDPFIFPYTLQYVGKVPYLYEMKNIFLWGQGPLLAIFSFFGFVYITYLLLTKKIKKNVSLVLFTLLFFIIYFAAFGRFAVGWMRYMLPIYPLLAVFAGFFVVCFFLPLLKQKGKFSKLKKHVIYILFFILFLIYPISFLSIYTKPNTRVEATDWILKNIEPGSFIAQEHWDDGVPIVNAEFYNLISLPLYEPDTQAKWRDIETKLETSDYIVIASNRLYVPLQKLTDCESLPEERCYTITAKYYQDLFSGKLGFTKVAEFSRYPTIPILELRLNDARADESFTVFDHPKVMIFKKN